MRRPMSDIDIVWRAALVVIASMAGEFERIRVTLHRDGYGEHEYPCVVIDIAIPAGQGATMGGTCVLSDACAQAVFSAESIIGANLREEVSRLRSHVGTVAEGAGVNDIIGSIPDLPEPEPEPVAAECASVAYPRWVRDALDLLREASDGLGWTPDRRRTADAILRSAASATEYQSKQRAAEEIRGPMTVLDSMHAADDDNLTEIGQFLEAAMDALVHPEMVPPWSEKDCDRCGMRWHFTRASPRLAPDEYVCPECAAYDQGYNDAAKNTESKSVPEDDKKSVLDKAVEYEDDRGLALPHHDDACRLLCSIEDKPHRAIKYISELIESHREDAARTTEHKSMGQTWAPSQTRVAAYRAATTRLDRVAALNHSLQDFIEDTDPPNRRALISLLTDYICAVEGIGDRATENQSVDREDRDGTKTFKAECEGDTVQVTVRSGGAMLTVYDDELGSTAHVLVEPVIATLSAAGLVEPSATKYKSIAYLPEDEQAGERVDEYLRESLPDDDAQPITRDTECSFIMSLTPEQADTIATAMCCTGASTSCSARTR